MHEMAARAVEGDIIQFNGTTWGIYVGDGNVVYLTGGQQDGLVGSMSSSKRDKPAVSLDTLTAVEKSLGGGTIKNAEFDNKYAPLPCAEIVVRAYSKVGLVVYGSTFKNSLDFALWCRYGEDAMKAHNGNCVLM